MRSRVWKQASGAHDAIDVPACLTGSCPRRLRKKEKKKIDKVRFFTSLGRVDATRVLPSRALHRRRRAP